jgi:hypothetical protein
VYSLTKWMLAAALIGANSAAIARADTYNLDITTRDNGVLLATFDGSFNFIPSGTSFCKAPFLCPPGVRPNFKNINVSDLIGINGLLANGTFTSEDGRSQGRNGRFVLADNLGGPPSVVYNKGNNSFNHGMFVCGEVVSGYNVTCASMLTKTTVSAPEIDTGFVVSGLMLVLGCLAILRGRKQSIAVSGIITPFLA